MITATITNKVIDTSLFKNLAVAEDAIDTVQFSLAKTYDGTDLSAGTVYALWVIPGGDGDMTELATSVDGDNLLASWELKDGVVSRKGMVEFQLVVIIGETNIYQTKVARFFVDRKLDPDDLEFTPAVLTAHLASVIAERTLAEAAADEAEAVLEDTDFQTVAADLALGEASTIKIVSTDIADVSTVADNMLAVTTVANGIADIDKVEDIAADVSAVALIHADVSAVALIDDAVSAVNLNATNINAVNANKTNIDTVAANNANVTAVGASIANVNAVAADATDIGVVATDLALGASSNVKKVAAIDSDVQAVAAIDTEVTALAGKTTEIDALYAELDAIGAKATVASVDAIKGTGWTNETIKGNADALVAHKAAVSPHIMTDGVTNYSYGLSISTLRGFRHLQLNIEEEV